jgi:hypothetical protein
MAKNKYEVISIPVKGELGETERRGDTNVSIYQIYQATIELEEGDIPIALKEFMTGYATSTGEGGQKIESHIVVLRPIKK